MIKQIVVGLSTIGILAVSSVLGKAATDLTVVDSAALGTQRNLPWSEPVQIDDPFEGSFIGVFDRHSFHERFLDTQAQIEVQSLWSQEFIRFLSIVRDRDCLSHLIGTVSTHNCTEFNNARNITELFIRIEDQVFQVSGQNSTFLVSRELAEALQNASEEEIGIRLVTENGETIDSEIGEDTVTAWKTVYQSQDVSSSY
ncbi:MAG: hypothetical protein F6K04_07250 [Leptolyngbya sp. SIO4C5]|nr:hypothetical protein [Leptolyngbya sp. SIO4C5]